jgi:hypothetical protein
LLSSKDVQDYKDGQLKWIIENGINPSGMPAWKGTLSDEAMWKVVDFLRHLPPKGSLGIPDVYSCLSFVYCPASDSRAAISVHRLNCADCHFEKRSTKFRVCRSPTSSSPSDNSETGQMGFQESSWNNSGIKSFLVCGLFGKYLQLGC